MANKTRTRHIKTEYEKQRGLYCEASYRHVAEFESFGLPEDGKRGLFAISDEIRQLGNTVKGVMKKRIDQMKRTKRYRKLMSDYAYCITRIGRVKEDSEEYKALEKRKSSIGKEMTAMQKEFHITWDDVRQEMIKASDGRDINSIFCLKEAESVWQSIEKALFSNGKKLHFKRRGDLPCIRAKQSNRGIVIKAKDGELKFSMDGIGEFGVKIPKGDLFLQDEARKVLRYLENPEVIEKNAVETYTKTGTITDTFRPCYASIRCETIRGKLRVYIQVTIEGRACPKKKKDGSPRHDFTKTGIVGDDIGTQSNAAYSKNGIMLDNLAERNHKSTKESAALERRLLRKMDRSRRAANPDNYNADGTVKPKKDRKPWKESNNYKKLKVQYQDIARRNADSRKFAIREMANSVRELGDELYTEPKNAKKLQRKAKESKITVREDGSVKHSKRKRFGKSVLHRCPGMFQAELKKKFGDHYHEVPGKYRASQYDHTADDFIKKELNDRMFDLSDGTKVQRDLYSAFLLSHPNADKNSPDYDACLKGFAVFKTKMDALILSIKASGYKICNSGI